MTRIEEPTTFPDLDMDASLAFPKVYNANFYENDIACNKGPNVEETLGPMEATMEGEVPLSCTGSEEGDLKNVKFAYQASTWSKEHFTFELEHMEFLGDSLGTSNHYFDMPTFMHLFRKFWPWDLIKQIWNETNCYAGSLDENGILHGRDGWYCRFTFPFHSTWV